MVNFFYDQLRRRQAFRFDNSLLAQAASVLRPISSTGKIYSSFIARFQSDPATFGSRRALVGWAARSRRRGRYWSPVDMNGGEIFRNMQALDPSFFDYTE